MVKIPLELALVSIFIARSVSTSLLAPCLPSMSKEYGVTYEGAGTLISMIFLGYSLTVLFIGPLMDRIGRRFLIVIGVGLVSLATFAYAIVDSLLLGVVVSFFFGVAGIGDLTATATLADIGKDKRGHLLSIAHGTYAFGAVVVPLVAGLALDHGITFRFLFLGATLVSVIVFSTFIMSPTPPLNYKNHQSVFGLFKKTGFRFGLVVAFFYTCAEVTITIWTPTFFKDKHGVSDTMASLSVTMIWLVMMIGRFGLSRFIDKTNPKFLFITLSLGSCISSSFAILASDFTIAYIGVILSGFFMSAIFPALQGFITRIFPLASGQVLSFMGATVGFAGFFTPLFIGTLADHIAETSSPSYGITISMLICPLSLVFFILSFLFQPKRFFTPPTQS